VPNPYDDALRLAAAGRFSGAIASVHASRAAAASREATDEAVRVFRRIARHATEAGDTGEAVRALSAASRLRPRWPDVQLERAVALLAAGERDAARGALRNALGVNPRYASARLEWALLDASEGLIGEALAAVHALLPAEGAVEPRAFEQGIRALERADWEEAAAHLRRGLGLHDAWLGERVDRIRAALEAGAWARAAQLAAVSLERHATYPDLHALLGEAESGMGHLDDAVASYAHAVALHPDYHAARLGLARALEGLGLREQALDEVGRVLESDPRNEEAATLARAWNQTRRPRRRKDVAEAA
jgi:tetratricopeptide (TPR) repeat protein